MISQKEVIIGVVGPCGAGKTTLIAGLRAHHIFARHIAQEHSFVKDMWKKISMPDILIYLHVSYQNSILRKTLSWNVDEYLEQIRRLEHARQNANLIVDTDYSTPEEILEYVVGFIKGRIFKNPQIEI